MLQRDQPEGGKFESRREITDFQRQQLHLVMSPNRTPLPISGVPLSRYPLRYRA